MKANDIKYHDCFFIYENAKQTCNKAKCSGGICFTTKKQKQKVKKATLEGYPYLVTQRQNDNNVTVSRKKPRNCFESEK